MQKKKKSLIFSAHSLPSALITVIFLLFTLGFMMVFNTTAAEILDADQTLHIHKIPLRHLSIAIVSAFFAALIRFIGYQMLLKVSPFLFSLCIVFLLLVFVPGIGKMVNGARRWVSFFGISWQPSEVFQFILPLYYLEYIRKKSVALSHFSSFILLITIFSFPLLLILLEPNNSTIFILFFIILHLFFITGMRKSFWIYPLVLFILMGGVAAIQLPYVSSRIEVFLHPERDLQGKGHQPYQAKIAAGSGKIFGKGLGNSLQKFSYLPEAQNDYIAAIFAEETGFLGILLLIALYMIITYLGIYIASHAADREAFYLASSITFIFSIQAFLNLAVVSGLFPSTGLNLPFFSQGGTNLVMNFFGIGILLSISDSSLTPSRS